MKVPKSMQGVVQYCPNGGMPGMYVTEAKLVKFADRLKRKHIDEVIPLDGDEQPIGKDCPTCNGDPNKVEMDNSIYWETETGSHGWCCATCGEVFQWG